MDDSARAALQGHDIDRNDMGCWYDNRPLNELIDEQARVAPRGLVAEILGPSMHISGDVPNDAIGLVEEYLAGNLGTIDFANRMEAIRRDASVQQSRRLVV